ncbi:MAG: hypothetical protein AAF943_03815 [Pseudomonadota bacterium]
MKTNVLVYVPDGLIEDDIVTTVREVLENATIRFVDSIDAVRATLDSYKDWAWAVIDMSEEDLTRPELREAFAKNNALPVVLSPPVQDPDVSDWVFLDPPFSAEMLREALEKTRPH